MDVYRGEEHVTTVNDFNDVKLGTKNIPFVRRGAEVLHPDPVRDGLVLWYDFSGMHNSFSNRDVAEDLSGNGNHGTLQNFNYTDESGYKDDGLKFDGVDDEIETTSTASGDKTFIITLKSHPSDDTKHTSSWSNNLFYLRKFSGDRLFISLSSNGQQTFNVSNVFSEEKEEIKTVGFLIKGKEVSLISDGFILESRLMDDEITPVSLENIGHWNESSNSYWDDSIYEVKLYNRALTEEEIQHNYQIEKERFNL